jgi:hypothetical protein
MNVAGIGGMEPGLRNAEMIFTGRRLTANKLALVTLCAGIKKVTSARCQSATFLSLHFDTLIPHKLAFLTLQGHTSEIAEFKRVTEHHLRKELKES